MRCMGTKCETRLTKKTGLWWLVCFCMLMSVGCSSQNEEMEEPPATSLSNIEMRLSIDLWPGYYPAVIADKKGWFQEAGLDLILNIPGNTDKMLAQFSAGTIDAVAVAFGDAILVSRQMPDVAVILVTDESAGGDAVLAMNPDVLTQLNGKRIGTNLGGFGELLIRRLLVNQGVSVDEVSLVNVDASKVPRLLENGDLDLGHTWSPYVGRAIESGATVVFSSADTPGLIPDTIAVTGEFRRDHPDAIRRFLKVWFKAQKWWLENYVEGNQIIAEATGQNVKNISLEGIRLLNWEDNVLTFKDRVSEKGLPNVLHLYNDFYVRSGVIRKPAAPTILASEFLE